MIIKMVIKIISCHIFGFRQNFQKIKVAVQNECIFGNFFKIFVGIFQRLFIYLTGDGSIKLHYD